jgi:hypothetical protein
VCAGISCLLFTIARWEPVSTKYSAKFRHEMTKDFQFETLLFEYLVYEIGTE